MSEPKLKAKELVAQFKMYAYAEWHEVTGFDQEILIKNAKACAIICCDEIIDFMIADDHKHKDASWSNSSEMVYWHNVKKEIQKL